MNKEILKRFYIIIFSSLLAYFINLEIQLMIITIIIFMSMYQYFFKSLENLLRVTNINIYIIVGIILGNSFYLMLITTNFK